MSSAEHCRNCGAPLRGEFCAQCGQREGGGDVTFGEAVGEILGDVFTWDSRIWRTFFPLLFRPGFLSAEFNAGRRARYMPPFRLYIVVSFLMFLVMSLGAADMVGVNTADTVSSEADQSQEATDAAAPGAQAREQPAEDDQRDGVTINILEDGPPWALELERRLEKNAERVTEDPSDYMESLLEYLPQVMFVMLPLFALLLKLFYLFSPFHYLQHLVFALHYHTFVYLLYIASEATERLGLGFWGLFAIALLIYLPIGLRRAYGSSWGGAIGKSLLLMISYGTALIAGMGFAALAVLAAM